MSRQSDRVFPSEFSPERRAEKWRWRSSRRPDARSTQADDASAAHDAAAHRQAVSKVQRRAQRHTKNQHREVASSAAELAGAAHAKQRARRGARGLSASARSLDDASFDPPWGNGVLQLWATLGAFAEDVAGRIFPHKRRRTVAGGGGTFTKPLLERIQIFTEIPLYLHIPP
jgi:hypothetical protein